MSNISKEKTSLQESGMYLYFFENVVTFELLKNIYNVIYD